MEQVSKVHAEVWYDPAYMRTTIKVHYQREPHGDIYSLSYAIADELLTSPAHADLAVAAAVSHIINEYRTRFYKGPWGQMEQAILMALECPQTLAPLREVPEVPDTYRENAVSEFEGVGPLDESLWNDERTGLV